VAISFGLVATYARWKGHELFIEAARTLMLENQGLVARFYIVGGPIYATAGSQVDGIELASLVGRSRLEADFGLVPFQSDIARAYRSVNVVVHASTKPEPFGRTIVEAMACGRAVIAARAGGATELFQHGENALGFEPGDAHSLARQMARLATDPRLRSELETHGRKHAEEHFGRSRLGANLVDTYSAFSRSRAPE
jgi:glycosyltransferase involved in cell wall biosynthesis